MQSTVGPEFAYFRVETTKVVTAERESKKWPIQLRHLRSLEADRTWIFTDGSGTGWYAAVILRPGCEKHYVTGYNERSGHNVGAELDGIVLGLENIRQGEKIAIVSDYLWNAYSVNGWYKINDSYLHERVLQIRRILETKGLSDALFIHHRGHQKDSSDFSRWNNVADRLCRKQNLINCILNLLD